jgi:hypothetical protein
VVLEIIFIWDAEEGPRGRAPLAADKPKEGIVQGVALRICEAVEEPGFLLFHRLFKVMDSMMGEDIHLNLHQNEE